MTLRLRDLLAQQGDPLQLEVLTGDVGLERPVPPDAEVASPGLALAGYTDRFVAKRLHVLGETEVTYLASLDAAARRKALEGIFAFELPAIIITKGQDSLLRVCRCGFSNLQRWIRDRAGFNCGRDRHVSL